MQSLKELYKIGNGPSSSHTMGPQRACTLFHAKNPDADRFEAILYGSLALTGKGHLTDYIIRKTLEPLPVAIVFDKKTPCHVHPNTMDIIAYKGLEKLDFWRVYSVGGGTIRVEGQESVSPPEIYPHRYFREIGDFCKANNLRLWQYVEMVEGREIWGFLTKIWMVMQQAVHEGLNTEGVLPGPLKLERQAKAIYNRRKRNESLEITEDRLISAYSYAVCETNAASV